MKSSRGLVCCYRDQVKSSMLCTRLDMAVEHPTLMLRGKLSCHITSLEAWPKKVHVMISRIGRSRGAFENANQAHGLLTPRHASCVEQVGSSVSCKRFVYTSRRDTARSPRNAPLSLPFPKPCWVYICRRSHPNTRSYPQSSINAKYAVPAYRS